MVNVVKELSKELSKDLPKDNAFFFSLYNLRKGRDNKYYVVLKDENNKKYWSKHPKYIYETGYSKFTTHRNGATPFRVYVSDNKKTVHVYTTPKSGIDLDYDNDDYCDFSHTEHVISYTNLKKVFIPEGCCHWNPNEKYPGNSILLQLENSRYIYIGEYVYEFATPDDIVEYYSQMGNSDVPYPVALGINNVYFMLDQVYCPKNQFSGNEWEDCYSEFYGHKPRGDNEDKLTTNKFPNYKKIFTSYD